jgi:hypothetical protein
MMIQEELEPVRLVTYFTFADGSPVTVADYHAGTDEERRRMRHVVRWRLMAQALSAMAAAL